MVSELWRNGTTHRPAGRSNGGNSVTDDERQHNSIRRFRERLEEQCEKRDEEFEYRREHI
jgi:hypothetical protein